MNDAAFLYAGVSWPVMDDMPYQRKTHKKRKHGVFFKRGGPHRTKKFSHG